jgi:hypothetical protein
MKNNCDTVIEKYLLNQNPLYAFSFPLSLLIAIIIFGVAKAYKWSENSYINQILIPILGFLLVNVLIDFISKMMINNQEKMKLVELCKNNVRYKVESKINNLNIEKFSNNENVTNNQNEIKITQEKNEIVEHNCQIPNISPFPLEYSKDGSLCIQDSNCCSLCSGSNSNPCNIIAPVPGPQWLPSSAQTVQNNLKNNKYTQSKCPIK